MFKSIGSWYFHQLQHRPIVTKSVSAALLVGAGDLLTQTIQHERHHELKFDFERTLKMASFGLFMVGPTLHLWYKFLDKYIAKKYPSGYIPTKKEKILNATRQMAVDQLGFSPFSLFQFLTYMGLIEGHSMSDVWIKLKKDLFPTLLVNWMVWPAVQLINFTIVPYHFRVLFVNAVSIFWNAYLSYVQHKK
ncbi:hypothetical protein ABK040_012224 [Willaertia magna]